MMLKPYFVKYGNQEFRRVQYFRNSEVRDRFAMKMYAPGYTVVTGKLH